MSFHQKRVLLVPFGPILGVEFTTTHCLERFRERANIKGTAGEVIRHLEGWFGKALPAELKPGRMLKKLLNNGCRPAKYYLLGNPKKGLGWILVVENNVLRTIHRNQSGEWRLPDPPADSPKP